MNNNNYVCAHCFQHRGHAIGGGFGVLYSKSELYGTPEIFAPEKQKTYRLCKPCHAKFKSKNQKKRRQK